jgi:hypothetical protein
MHISMQSQENQSTRAATPQLPLPCFIEYMILIPPVSGTRQAKYMRSPSSVMEGLAGNLQPGIVKTSGVPEQVEPVEAQCMISPGWFQ